MFKSWLISNFEVVYFVCAVLVIGGVAIFRLTDASGAVSPQFLFTSIAAGVIAFLFCFATDPKIGPIPTTILLIGAYIWCIYTLQDPNGGAPDSETLEFIKKANTIVLAISAIAIIPSFFVTRYANRNFDDVVSCRWLYRNSDKDVFVSTWKYTINRFFMAFLVFFAIILLVVFTIWLSHNETNEILASLR